MPSVAPRPGVYAASLTPFYPDLRVNHAALARHVQHLLARGCDGVVVLGTTGEAASLSVRERRSLLARLLDAGIPPGRLVVGTGCTALPETLALTRHAVGCGVGGVLVLPPFYYRTPPEDGLFAYFDRLIQAVGGGRMLLYHYPGLTGIPFTSTLVSRLLDAYPGVVAGMKDSSGDPSHMAAMCRRFPGFQVFAGSEAYLLSVMRAGGAGCITATANVTGPLAAAVFAAREDATADRLQALLTAHRRALEAFPFVPALKHLVAARTGERAWHTLRPPLTPLSPDERAAVDRLAGTLPLLRDGTLPTAS